MSAVGWVLWHARPSYLVEATILGPLGGHWWRLLTSEFAYFNGLYAFVTLLAIAVFGWLVERRHGPAVVLALFFGAGVAGALVTIAVYPVPVVTGANGAALALLAAWAGPDLLALRSGDYYEGDLLGAAAFAVVLLALPFLVYYVSWIDGLIGGAIGLLAGRGLAGVGEPAL
jgi:membrane associated rhomboid family serine protease